MVENARVVIGDGTVLDHGSVAVSGDRIVLVSAEPVDAPSARRIDAAGGTVMPGLIDTHVHLLMENLFAQPRSDSAMASFMAERLPDRLKAYTDAGITTVMSAGDYWPYVGEVRDRVRSGDLIGPRIYTAGPILTAPDGHPAATFCGVLDMGGPNAWCRDHLTIEVATPEAARVAVAEMEGADYLKLVNAAAAPGMNTLEPDVVGALVEAAHARGLRTYAHISEHEKAIAAIEAGLDGLAHLTAVPSRPGDLGQDELGRLVDLMEAEGVAASTTLTVFDDFVQITAAQGDEQMSQMVAGLLAGMQETLSRIADVNANLLALGTDSPHLDPADAYHREVELVSQVGLTPAQVIQAATQNAAMYMGLGSELGTLEAGKLADFLIVDGDPTSDLSALREVVMVVKGGEIIYERE